MNKHDPIYLLACGTAPIPIIERDGLGTISKTTTGTVAARWWIAEEDAARVAAQPTRRMFRFGHAVGQRFEGPTCVVGDNVARWAPLSSLIIRSIKARRVMPAGFSCDKRDLARFVFCDGSGGTGKSAVA